MKKCSFLRSRSSSRNQREPSVGEAKTVVTQSKASVGNASISQAINGETSIEWVGSKDRSRCSSSVIESSLEIRFCSSALFSIVQVGGSNLSSLYVIVDRTKSNVFPSLGGSEGSIECSLGLSNLRSVLNGSSGSHGQEGTDEQFVHLDEFPENLQSELPMSSALVSPL